jgi:hypothetical protein
MPSERGERSPVSHTPSLRRRLLVAFAGAMLLLGAISAAVARAESYGELGHFGGAGTGPGQFQIPSEKVETHAFGV